MRNILRKKLCSLVVICLVIGVDLFAVTGDTVTTKSGLKYIITEKGNGVQPKSGDKIEAHYTGKFIDGKIFDSSVQRGIPFKFDLGKGQVIKGWDEGFGLLSIGDKATFIIPYQLAYGEAGRPPTIPGKTNLVFDVELLGVEKPVVAVPYSVDGLEEVSTGTGLKYLKVREGTGPKPNTGQMVAVHYTGYLINGKTFDSSVERGQPFQFPLGQGRVIKGWEEGVAMMKTGEQRRFIIPPELAYGEKGYPNLIPPNSILIFDVELLSIGNNQSVPK